MRRGNELQGEEYFRKRIEKRSIRLHISNINSRKLQTFRFSRKVWTFCVRDNPIDLIVASRKVSKISILATRCRVNSNFLSLYKATVGITVVPASCLSDFRLLKSLMDVSENGKFDGTSKKFGLSLMYSRFRLGIKAKSRSLFVSF